MLTVHSFTFNPFSENTYLIYTKELDCIIIDPGCYTVEEKKELTSYIKEKGLKPVSIFLTHSHIDHIFGLDYLKKRYQVPILGHPEVNSGLRSTELVAQLYGLSVELPPSVDTFINEGEQFTLGSHSLKVLFCPGHSPDHLVLYAEKEGVAIVGDVIFKESIGRSDLPGGNFETLMESINQKLLTLPSQTILYPGHGPKTTIKEEITNNPFLK